MAEDLNPVEELLEIINGMALVGPLVKLYKRECAQLITRLTLLVPMLEEAREKKYSLPDDAVQGLIAVSLGAKQIVSLCEAGPKLYLILERESFSRNFVEIGRLLAQSLDRLSLEKLQVSDEAWEPVRLVHLQARKVQVRDNTFESRLHEDLLKVLSGRTDKIILQRLAEGLNLKTTNDLRKELQSFQEVKGGNGTDERIKTVMQLLLGTIQMSEVRVEDLSMSGIPHDFICPISLELMKDPVIVATGQTYERSTIQRWFDTGRKTCPKTGVVLAHLGLTPNYVLRSVIEQWCESRGMDLPEKMGIPRSSKNNLEVGKSHAERATIGVFVQKLSSGQPDLQREAVEKIRLLAKESSENRDYIAEAGALPFLVNLLGSKDLRTQEHAVTALLNLSINENNKGPIVMLGAVEPIVEVLKSGSMAARENAAATLFNLSVIDENKITIGATDAIPALVNLLRDGTTRGKKDAATALYNLSIYRRNKSRAVKSGVVPPLMDMLANQMVDESLTVLAILATHQDGRQAIGDAGAVPVLVELIKNGSSRNRENAAAVLYQISLHDSSHLVAAQKLGVAEPLTDLAQNGTARAKRKAIALLELLNKIL